MAIEISSPSSDVVAARILVVDDNPGTAETLARAVSRISPNLQVIAADGAKTALKQLDGEAVDLVITDMMMPDMNGLELIERLRKQSQGNQLYSILITAYEVPGLRESARRMKVNDVLIKPFPPEKICEIVRRALERTQPVPALTAPSAALEPSRPIAHLLVADDNPSNISLLMRYLQTESYRITTASNGTETLEKLRAEPPDLLLLDVNMPEMDGFQVLEKMRADPALQHIPVIIVTAARLDPVDMQYALNMGADDYITKPFDRRELMARIRTRLRVKQAEDVLRRRSQYLDFLLETERMLAQPGSEEDRLASLLRRLSETLQAQCGYLWAKINDKIIFRAFLTNQTAPVSAPPPQVFSILEKFQQQPEGWFVEDVRKVTDCIFPPNDSVRSMAAVPLINQSGLLLVLSEQPGCFDQQAFSLLQSVAYMVSLVITCEKSDLL
ncbi:MAG: response regulator [Anaerolineales bacterium]|nr:response regulator [Anaerolineales bacterium]MDW8278364.1 response regulator [Anaerolineales bacterium]